MGLEGAGADANRVRMVERRVVLPALSRPRSRMEYSVCLERKLRGQRVAMKTRGKEEGRPTFFSRGPDVERLAQMIHDERWEILTLVIDIRTDHYKCVPPWQDNVLPAVT